MAGHAKKTKYHEVADALRNQIRSGALKPGDQVSSLDQLCQEFQVSQITVRHAIASLVHEGLLRRIQGKGTYVASPVGQNMNIALVFPHLCISNDPNTTFNRLYDMPLIGAIEQSVREVNGNLLLTICDDDVATERKNLLSLPDRQVDGAIIFSMGGEENRDVLDELRASGMPLVLIDRYPTNWLGNYVVTDNFAGSHQAVEALLHQGFTRIYFVGNNEDSSSCRDRREGFIAAMRGHALYAEHLVKLMSSTRVVLEDADDIVAEILDDVRTEPEAPFAIFTSTTQAFSGVWQSLQKADVEPKNIGFACFDVLPFSLPLEKMFVRIVQPLEQMGRESVRMILESIAGSSAVEQIMLCPSVEIADAAGFVPYRGHASGVPVLCES